MLPHSASLGFESGHDCVSCRPMARYIFITGGVVSSLGKGLASAALGALLQAAFSPLDLFPAVALFLLPGFPEAEPRFLGL